MHSPTSKFLTLCLVVTLSQQPFINLQEKDAVCSKFCWACYEAYLSTKTLKLCQLFCFGLSTTTKDWKLILVFIQSRVEASVD